MKAVVLVGGEGTRMRPLTETIPKPLIPLVDRPFLHHVLDHLAVHGIHEVLLSSSYLEEAFAPFLRERHGDPVVTWITEATPLGTGGAIANAVRHLDDTFLVLNGDILTDLDLTAMIRCHREREAVATIALTRVDDARPFGLVDSDASGAVLAFREKPTDLAAGSVNAGTYVLEPEAVEGIAIDRAVSVEREVFPSLIARGRSVYGFSSPSYWLDLGTPEKYLQATFDALDGRVMGLSYVAPYVDRSAVVSLQAHLGRWVVAGPASRVGDDAEVEDSVLLAGAVVDAAAKVRDSIIGPGAVVGRRAIVEGGVVAEGARVAAGVSTNGARVGAGQVLER